MIENTKLTIICGGYFVCTSAWDRDRAAHRFHDTFDFWLPVSGGATVETVAGRYTLRPGNVYFVPGRYVLSWKCDTPQMPLYWIATAAESFYMRHRLAVARGVREWPLASVPSVEPVFRRFNEYFIEEKAEEARERKDEDSRPRDDSPLGLGLKIESVLTYLVGDLIESTQKNFRWEDFVELERLRPAIDYMDEHFLRNPQLDEIARQSGLVPQYFHRIFKRETGVTPFKYMEERRLLLSCKLLNDSCLSVKQVADKVGYNSASRFTRAFSQRFGMPPSRVRLAPTEKSKNVTLFPDSSIYADAVSR